MHKTVKKWDLDRNVRYNTLIFPAKWISRAREEKSQWKIKISHSDEQRDEYADILISARGFSQHVALARYSWHRIFQGT